MLGAELWHDDPTLRLHELDDNGRPNPDLVIAATHDMRIEARTLLEFNRGDVVGRFIRKSRMRDVMDDPKGVDASSP